MTRLTGGCLCGAVRYEAEGALQIALSCHCRDCQYASGGAPSHVIVMRSHDVTVARGNAKEYWGLSAKGSKVARLFCEQCGTPLFAKNEKHPEFLAIKAGSLDDPSNFRAQANIWTQSAQPWHHLDAAVPRFKQNPELGLAAFLELVRTSAVKLGRKLVKKRLESSRPLEEGPAGG